MDKKKFYIILLSVVVFFVVGYLIIYLKGSLGGYKFDPNGGGAGSSNEKVEIVTPRLAFASGEVLSVNDALIEVNVDTGKGESIIKVNLVGDVDLISGDYNENGGLDNKKITKTKLSSIKQGDNVLFELQEPVRIDELNSEIFEIENIKINPPGNPEL